MSLERFELASVSRIEAPKRTAMLKARRSLGRSLLVKIFDRVVSLLNSQRRHLSTNVD